MSKLQQDFLAQCIAPSRGSLVPPNMENMVTVLKEQTVYGTLPNSSTGALVWQHYVSGDTLHYLTPVTRAASYSDSTITVKLGTYLPFNREVVSMSPDLNDDFVLGRVVGGQLTLKSDTTSTTSAAMSGEMHAVALTDLRGFRSLKVAELIQQTVTKKDAVWNVPCQQGVVTIIGPDICNEFKSPSAHLSIGEQSSGVGSVHTTIESHGSIIFSPEGILQQENVTTVPTPDIPWVACLDFGVRVSGLSVDGTTLDFHHYWATVDEDGVPHVYDTYERVYPRAGTFHHVHPTKNFYAGRILPPPQNAYYVGTKITHSGAPGEFYADIFPISTNLYVKGYTGPSRVLMWQNIAAGQNIQLTGVVQNELTVTSEIAPYVTTGGAEGPLNISLIPYLSALFNGPSLDYRRVYSGSDYARIVSMLDGDIGMRTTGRNTEEHQEAQAAGLFTSLGSTLGSLLGPFGQVGGHAVGNIADMLTGQANGAFAAGSFKRRRDEGYLGSARLMD